MEFDHLSQARTVCIVLHGSRDCSCTRTPGAMVVLTLTERPDEQSERIDVVNYPWLFSRTFARSGEHHVIYIEAYVKIGHGV
jgi:hypothetical protein